MVINKILIYVLKIPERLIYYYARRIYDTKGPEALIKLVDDYFKSYRYKSDLIMLLYTRALLNQVRRSEAWSLINSVFHNRDPCIWRDADFVQKRNVALSHGLPPILVVTLPKSGTLFINNTLRKGLSIPYLSLSPIGLFGDLLEPRVKQFCCGGSIAVEHVPPQKRDLELLYSYGIRKIVFHYRDIRQASLSFVHHTFSEEMKYIPRKDLIDWREKFDKDQKVFNETYKLRFTEWVQFLENWFEIIESDIRFKFMVTNYNELSSEQELVEKLLDFYDINHELFDWSVLSSDDAKERAGHFRKGLKDEWKNVLTPELHEFVNNTLKSYPRVLASLDN